MGTSAKRLCKVLKAGEEGDIARSNIEKIFFERIPRSGTRTTP
jgi:hypothetical protein